MRVLWRQGESCFVERGILGLDLISAHTGGGYPAKFPELFRRRLQGEPGGTQNRDQILDFTKKVDPSRSPRVADRSEISCYIGRCALMPFLGPRGPKICQKRSKNSNLGQNPGGCRPENPSLYLPLREALLVFGGCLLVGGLFGSPGLVQ